MIMLQWEDWMVEQTMLLQRVDWMAAENWHNGDDDQLYARVPLGADWAISHRLRWKDDGEESEE
jgi:hypothetical protein